MSWVIIAADNDFLSVQHWARTLTNADLLLVGSSGTQTPVYFQSINKHFHSRNCFLKKVFCEMSAIMLRPQCIRYDILPYEHIHFRCNFSLIVSLIQGKYYLENCVVVVYIWYTCICYCPLLFLSAVLTFIFCKCIWAVNHDPLLCSATTKVGLTIAYF